jgi:hypothetical protein
MSMANRKPGLMIDVLSRSKDRRPASLSIHRYVFDHQVKLFATSQMALAPMLVVDMFFSYSSVG